MSSKLFAIDPMAASSYGLYNSVKGEEGTFLDFLLNYNSTDANDGDNSWLSDLVTNDSLSNIKSSDVLQELSKTGAINNFNSLSSLSTMDLLSQMNSDETNTVDLLSQFTSSSTNTSDYFDAQVDNYKQILINEMKSRGMDIPADYSGADIYSQLLDL